MPEQPKVEAEAEKKPVESDKPSEATAAQPAKKKWETPRVIVSSTHRAGAKGTAALEVSPAVTTTTGTGVS